jgi:Mn2+/Fe2+ NRAMP family transporter
MSERVKNILKSIGPGILFAGAAIGGSHLIQSTRAGASYGFDLLLLVFLTNLLKYPFFEYGHRYAAATGESLIDGYKKMGNWAVYVFFFMSIFLGFVNTAGVIIITAGLFGNLLHISLGKLQSLEVLTAIVLAITLVILFFGKYKLLDKIVKVLIVTLSIFTVIAFFMAAAKGGNMQPEYIKPEIMNKAGLLFIISLMGWMPAPIEGSVWSSIWQKERAKETGHKPTLKEALIDFHIGYVGTTILAMFFVGLGALVMYGSGKEFSASGIKFSAQLVDLYTSTMGKFMEPVIASIALITMVSTTLTVVDAYPRSLEESLNKIRKHKLVRTEKLYWFFIIIMVVGGYLIITQLMDQMTAMLNVATILSFLAAPVFSVLNFKLVLSDNLPDYAKPPKWMKILSWAGLIFLTGFSIVFILSRFM